MKNAVLMRVVHSTRQLRYEFYGASDRHRRALDCFVELAAFDELHAEVAGAFALPDLVNRNDAWIFQAGGRFRFALKAFQMRFSGPGAQADHFERDGAIETFLMGAINHALTAASDFLQQLVIAKVCEHSNRRRGFILVRCSNIVTATEVIGL